MNQKLIRNKKNECPKMELRGVSSSFMTDLINILLNTESLNPIENKIVF